MKSVKGKKAQGMMMGGPRKPVSLLLGLVFLVFGGIPVLGQLGILEFSIPIFPQTVLYVVSVAGALFLLWDAVSEGMAMMGLPQMMRMATFGMAIVLLAVGLVPLLGAMGVIEFAFPQFADIILSALYVVTGVLLVYGGTQGF